MAVRLTPAMIKDALSEACGADVLPSVEKLKNTKNFSEFKLADALGQDVNYTRNQLYRLLKHNLVSFIRRKDKRKGWYIYYWTFRIKQVRFLIKSQKEDRLKRLIDWLHREEEGQFFSCKKGCMRTSFDSAVDLSYTCPECGEFLQLEDNSVQIKGIKEKIKELDDFLKKYDA